MAIKKWFILFVFLFKFGPNLNCFNENKKTKPCKDQDVNFVPN
jgi:hypothetical protein